MAGDWIKYVKGLHDKPEVIQVAVRLGISRYEVVGRLLRVWDWLDENIECDLGPDDPLRLSDAGQSLSTLKIACDLDEAFVDAVVSTGWFAFDGGNLILPNWGRHNGKSAKRRCLDALRKSETRKSPLLVRKLSENCPVAVRELSGCEADKNVTREEKRREDTDESAARSLARKPNRTDSAILETIYAAYPRKVGKTRAMREIKKALDAIRGRDSVIDPGEWLLERVLTFAFSPAGQAGQFTPHPATWFNGGRYDDDPVEWQRRDDERRPQQRGLPKLEERIMPRILNP